MNIKAELPIRTQSEANSREHWRPKAKQARIQRAAAAMVIKPLIKDVPENIVVTLTRIAPCKLDTDNLARSFKAIRDGVADALGIDDGSERITWLYAQRKGGVREYAVLVEIVGEDK